VGTGVVDWHHCGVLHHGRAPVLPVNSGLTSSSNT